MPAPRFAGEEVTLGGTTYIVPPLGFRRLKELLPLIGRIQLASSGEAIAPLEQLEDLLTLSHAALERNYPEMTKEELLDLVDFSTILPLISATAKASALVGVQEKNAPAVASPSVGPSSTADSPPLSDGVGSTSTSA